MRRREGVAVEAGVDAYGADLVDHVEVAHHDVDVGLDGQLARGAHDGEARLHGPGAACHNTGEPR